MSTTPAADAAPIAAPLAEQTFGPITRQTLALFAAGSGDFNPIHLDTDFARAAGLDDVFCHGMLSMAYLGRLLTDRFGEDRLRSFQVRFAAITHVHDTVTCRAVLRGRIDIGGVGHLVLDLEARKQDGTVTLTGEALVADAPDA